MTIPMPPEGGGPRPSSGMDPMPSSRPRPPLGDLPDETPDPRRPGRRAPAPDPGGRLELVAAGREDDRRHVVDVAIGELGDPEGLRARCGAPVGAPRPGRVPDGRPAADCPVCLAGAGSSA